eukprot:IDg2559t1
MPFAATLVFLTLTPSPPRSPHAIPTRPERRDGGSLPLLLPAALNAEVCCVDSDSDGYKSSFMDDSDASERAVGGGDDEDWELSDSVALSSASSTPISTASPASEVSAVLFVSPPRRCRRDTAPKTAISPRCAPPRHTVAIDLTVVDVDDESPIRASRSTRAHVDSPFDLVSASNGEDSGRHTPPRQARTPPRNVLLVVDLTSDDDYDSNLLRRAKTERAAVLPAGEGVRGARGKTGSANGAFDRDDELTTSHKDAAVGDEAHGSGDGRALMPFQRISRAIGGNTPSTYGAYRRVHADSDDEECDSDGECARTPFRPVARAIVDKTSTTRRNSAVCEVSTALSRSHLSDSRMPAWL